MKMQNIVHRRVGVERQHRITVEDGSKPVEVISEQRKAILIVKALRKMRLVGLRQALKPGTSWKESAFWIGVFFLCVSYTVYLTWLSVEEYSTNPTTNTLHDDANINSVFFPAISVTGTMAFTKSGLDEAYEIYEKHNLHEEDQENYSWTDEGVTKLLFAVDHFCEMVSSFASKISILKLTQTLNLKAFSDWVRDQDVTIRDDPSDSILQDQVMPFIRKNTLDCKSILVACMWESNQQNCSELFVPVQTDVGMGCTFNRIPEELLRTSQGVMSLMYNRTTSDDELAAWNSWDIDTELRNSVDRLKSSRLFPRSQNAAGNMKGLSFLLMHKNDEEFSCPVMNSKGFLVGVHHPFEEPQMMTSGVAVPPGHEVLVKVRGEVTLADPELRSLAIEKRNCYFQDESFLKLYSRYTLGNCRRECLANRIAAECKCQQLSMSSGKNETICGPLSVDCVRNVTRELDRNGYDDLCEGPKCLAPCTDIKYETNVSYLPYHSNNIFDFSETNEFKLKPLSSNASTSIVHVTYESDRVTTRERKVVLAFAFLVGVIGGIWGMTLEFSVASFFNILAGLGVLFAPVCAMRCIRRSASNSSTNKLTSDEPGGPANNETPSMANDNVEELEMEERGDEESSSSFGRITNNGVEGEVEEEIPTETETADESCEDQEEFYDSSGAEHPEEDNTQLESDGETVESQTVVSEVKMFSTRNSDTLDDCHDKLFDLLRSIGQINFEEMRKADNFSSSSGPSKCKHKERASQVSSTASEDIQEPKTVDPDDEESPGVSETIKNYSNDGKSQHEYSTEIKETQEEMTPGEAEHDDQDNIKLAGGTNQEESPAFTSRANVSSARIVDQVDPLDDNDDDLSGLLKPISRKDSEESNPAYNDSIVEETTDLTNELELTDPPAHLDKEIDELMEIIIQ